jgi:hypothetical protein
MPHKQKPYVEAALETVSVQPFKWHKPTTAANAEHLPRDRVVHPINFFCPCCDGPLPKQGDNVPKMLEWCGAK